MIVVGHALRGCVFSEPTCGRHGLQNGPIEGELDTHTPCDRRRPAELHKGFAVVAFPRQCLLVPVGASPNCIPLVVLGEPPMVIRGMCLQYAPCQRLFQPRRPAENRNLLSATATRRGSQGVSLKKCQRPATFPNGSHGRLQRKPSVSAVQIG